ncbi:CDP-glycerol glycerophosphotransferase family protein [Mollicutes bacterium LVI A0039]|nr:CDP-glycerol glycerophosphotransferase family protein [Mollicutes bacterium LVI A0039]
MFPLKDNLIVFEGSGQYENDRDLLTLFTEVKKNYPNYECIYICDEDEDLMEEDEVLLNSENHIRMLARAKYLFVCGDSLPFFSKRPNQIYVQTLSATFLNKTFLDDPYIEQIDKKKIKQQVKHWDYLVSPNRYASRCLRSAYGYNGQVLELGLPRNQHLHHVSEDEVFEYLYKHQVDPNVDKAILYVAAESSTNESKQLDWELLESTPGIKTYIYSKNFDVEKMIKYHQYESIVKVQDLQELMELFIISDLLVSDYSSKIFEYLVVDKPIVLLPRFLQAHIKTQQLYMDYNLLPAEQIDDTNRLIEIAQNLNSYKAVWAEELMEFRNQMVLEKEARASSLILKEVLKK